MLKGFKAIAAYLEALWGVPVSPKSAWRYSLADADPLPCTVARNVAWSKEEDLDRWARRQVQHRGGMAS